MTHQNTIPMKRITINKNTIFASSESTIWVDQVLPEYVRNYTPESFISLYRQVVKQIKESGAGLKHKYRTFSKIKELNKVLPEIISEHVKFFDYQAKLWQEKLNKGLVSPTSDDDELKELFRQAAKIHKAYSRSEPIGQFLSIYNDLNDILQETNYKNSNRTFFL